MSFINLVTYGNFIYDKSHKKGKKT